jgi:hypothetical protein
VELGNERSVQPDKFHFTYFTFRLKRNSGKTTYLPALDDLYAGKKCRKEIDFKKKLMCFTYAKDLFVHPSPHWKFPLRFG